MKRINLRTSQGHYPILIGRNLLGSLGIRLKQLKLGQKVLIVSNRKVARHYLRRVRPALVQGGFRVFLFLLPYGDERDKSERVLFELWKRMAQIPLERTSTVVALGGGVVGDVSAFAASTYMRGISLIQVPTTLLAQVDSAIGGKTAIDLPAAKNLIGTFYQPKMVVSDLDALRTLSVSEWRNSFAEVIKYGVIRDRELFRLLERKAGSFLSAVLRRSFGAEEFSFLETIVWRSARIKASIVARDERETKGERMILNYGHTFAHALEAASGYRLPHGEAVAIGMVLAGRLSRQRGLLAPQAETRQRRLITSLGLPVEWHEKKVAPNKVLVYMRWDKKVRCGKLRLVLPRSIGRVEIREGISEAELRRLLHEA